MLISESAQLKASIYAHQTLGKEVENEGLEWSRICRAYEAGYSEGYSEGLKDRVN